MGCATSQAHALTPANLISPHLPTLWCSHLGGESGAGHRGACKSPNTELGHCTPLGERFLRPSGHLLATARARASFATEGCICGLLDYLAYKSHQDRPLLVIPQFCRSMPGQQLWMVKSYGAPDHWPLLTCSRCGAGLGWVGRWVGHGRAGLEKARPRLGTGE